MVQMAMAVKPMLGMIPPEPTSWNPKELFGLPRWAIIFAVSARNFCTI